jgi:error-prone DNA polymerase
VQMREVDINHSLWDNQLEERSGKYCALRLGFRQVKGLREDDIQVLLAGRKDKFSSVNELRDCGVPEAALERLADADAFRSIGLDRRQALWEVSTKDRSEALFKGRMPADAVNELIVLPDMALSEHVVHDYASLSLSLKAHPVSFVREKLDQLHIQPTVKLAGMKNGDLVKVAGLVLVRQRPGTAAGVCFMTIEDETGCANLVVFEKLFDTYRKEILQSRLIMVEGRLQIEGEVIHVIVSSCYDLSKLLRKLMPSAKTDPPLLTLSRADERSIPPGVSQAKIFHGGRNFK